VKPSKCTWYQSRSPYIGEYEVTKRIISGNITSCTLLQLCVSLSQERHHSSIFVIKNNCSSWDVRYYSPSETSVKLALKTHFCSQLIHVSAAHCWAIGLPSARPLHAHGSELDHARRQFMLVHVIDSITDTNVLHRPEPLLRNRQFRGCWRTSRHFVEPDGSLPCLQEPFTCPSILGHPYTTHPASLKSILSLPNHLHLRRFEVLTAVAMKNVFFLDVTPSVTSQKTAFFYHALVILVMSLLLSLSHYPICIHIHPIHAAFPAKPIFLAWSC
jgi:hypothetical protein